MKKTVPLQLLCSARLGAPPVKKNQLMLFQETYTAMETVGGGHRREIATSRLLEAEQQQLCCSSWIASRVMASR
jgi:hypothetical protein